MCHCQSNLATSEQISSPEKPENLKQNIFSDFACNVDNEQMTVGKYLEEPIPGTENTLISNNCPF